MQQDRSQNGDVELADVRQVLDVRVNQRRLGFVCRMSEPEAVLETRHPSDLLLPDRSKECFRKRHEIPADAVRELDGHDIGAAPFHFDGEEAARRSDFKHALSGKIDAAEIVGEGSTW